MTPLPSIISTEFSDECSLVYYLQLPGCYQYLCLNSVFFNYISSFLSTELYTSKFLHLLKHLLIIKWFHFLSIQPCIKSRRISTNPSHCFSSFIDLKSATFQLITLTHMQPPKILLATYFFSSHFECCHVFTMSFFFSSYLCI